MHRLGPLVFTAVTVVLSVAGVVRVGSWALAPDPAQAVLSSRPAVTTTTTTAPPTTTTTEAQFITGQVVTRRPTPATTTTLPEVPTRAWTWDELARCESGNRWSVTRGVYQGGLQFDARTWDSYVKAFPGFPADAHLASREQQIAVAEAVLAREGPNAWPTCSKRLGITGDGTPIYPAGPPYVEPD